MGSVGYGFKKSWASEIHHGNVMKFEILAGHAPSKQART